MDNTRQLTHLSLCTGYGGIDLGLGRALDGVRTVAYVEIEAFAVENLVAKIEGGLLDVAPVWSNLKTFLWSEFRGKVDILSGGFPCQPFSSAGRRGGDEDPRHLWPYIVRGIKELDRPPIIFLENVEGIISAKLKSDQWADPEGTPVLLHVLRELERLDYSATAGVFSAREVGAPHQRKRVFIMGVRSDLGQSGRDIVSTMLRDTETKINENVEYSKVKHGECPDGRSEEQRRLCISFRESSTAYPAPRGKKQFVWEPPRTTELGDTHSERRKRFRVTERDKPSQGRKTEKQCTNPSIQSAGLQGKTKSSMGRDLDGAPDRVDYAELCESLDNRTDELRLLGNGVVPDTAERAFRILWSSLDYSTCKPER